MIRQAISGGQYQPLTPQEVQAIHRASLEILQNPGVRVPNREALEVFRAARADIEEDRVRLSHSIVEDALASIPHEVMLAGRDPNQDLLLSGKRVHFGTGGSPTSVLSPGALTSRQAEILDVAQLAKLAEALEAVDFFVLPVTPVDIPVETIAINRFYAALTNTRKHIMGGLINLEGAHKVVQLGELIAGGREALRQRPVISCMVSWMISPLTFDPQVTDLLTFWALQGLPVALSAAPMAGSTSPVTLAGTLTQLNAEQLSGIVYTQLLRRGTPVLAGYIPGQMDMRSGGYLGGSPEFALMQAGATQLAQLYEIPIYCSAGMTDSKLPDEQAGYEKMMTLLLTALAGASFIHHAIGMLENMNIVSYEQMVLDNDITLMVKRILQGIATTPEHLAVESIRRVGPSHNYLGDKHTVQFMRQETIQPILSDRTNQETWKAKGSRDSRARAIDKVKAILDENPPSRLPQSLDTEIRARFDIRIGL